MMMLQTTVTCLCFLILWKGGAANLELTVSPSDAKVGDTITITCSHSSPQMSRFMLIERRKEGVKEEISTNSFLNQALRSTGRYSSTADVQNEGKDLTVKITISDAKVEDSGRIECLIPSEGRIVQKALTVSDDEVVYGLNLKVTPSTAQVGDTVTITCSLATRSHGFVTISRKGKDFRIKEIATNAFLNAEFKETGRYTSDVELSKIDGGKGMRMIVTLIVKDATLEDSGDIRCEAPAVGAIEVAKLQVTPT